MGFILRATIVSPSRALSFKSVLAVDDDYIRRRRRRRCCLAYSSRILSTRRQTVIHTKEKRLSLGHTKHKARLRRCARHSDARFLLVVVDTKETTSFFPRSFLLPPPPPFLFDGIPPPPTTPKRPPPATMPRRTAFPSFPKNSLRTRETRRRTISSTTRPLRLERESSRWNTASTRVCETG